MLITRFILCSLSCQYYKYFVKQSRTDLNLQAKTKGCAIRHSLVAGFKGTRHRATTNMATKKPEEAETEVYARSVCSCSFLSWFLTFARQLGSEIVTIAIGTDKTEYRVYKKLLCKVEFFSKMFKSEFKEGRSSMAELPEDDIHTFELFVGWLYSMYRFILY